ncbi:MAG: hypothetical protein AC479_05950 [miscellaneous Crenarchaeota group-6 archaeon AD8-1]|nr:MAG: hypothetical protein AC479_05950 [miscellaneous Crenarchaeota group-6 archaeon AD8-1]
MIGKRFIFLHKGLGCNSDLENSVFSTHNSEYLSYLDKLFKELYEGTCNSINVKVNETPDLNHFDSLISELEFARYFLKNKMQVTFLPHNIFQGRKAPDMMISSSSLDSYVEVKNIQVDEASWKFGINIVKKLNDLGFCFMVVVKASKTLATPAYIYQSKYVKDQTQKQAFISFHREIRHVKTDSSKITINTPLAEVDLYPTKKKKSYLGISTMLEVITQPPDYIQRIKYDILNKTIKRQDWIDDELRKNYIIAIDDGSIFFSLDTYNAELFGHATYYSPIIIGDTTGRIPAPPVPRIKINDQIKLAIKQGWKDYLVRMCILQNGRSVIPENKRGLFFNESILKNATALIVRNRKQFWLLANPFAEPKINNPNILKEFSDAKIGWE